MWTVEIASTRLHRVALGQSVIYPSTPWSLVFSPPLTTVSLLSTSGHGLPPLRDRDGLIWTVEIASIGGPESLRCTTWRTSQRRGGQGNRPDGRCRHQPQDRVYPQKAIGNQVRSPWRMSCRDLGIGERGGRGLGRGWTRMAGSWIAGPGDSREISTLPGSGR